MADKERIQMPQEYKGKPVYSFSRLDSFHNCQYGYYLGYILKTKGEDNIYSLAGTVLHDLVEQMQARTITNEQALKDFYLKMSLILNVQNHKFSSDSIKENYVLSLEHFLKTFKPVEKVVIPEKQFYTEINDIVLVGYIDGVVFNDIEAKDKKEVNFYDIIVDYDGTVDVVDYKTSSKYSAKDLDAHARQLVLYAYALMKEFQLNISKVYWNMLKYCKVTWQGATKAREMFVLRKEVVKKLRTELKKDLRAEGCSEIQIEAMLGTAESDNSLSSLPKWIQEKYTISDGIVEYPINRQAIEELQKYVTDTVNEINKKSILDDSEWTPRISKVQDNGFYCGNLCNYRKTCKHYKNYLADLKEGKTPLITSEPKTEEVAIDLSKLFG